MNREKLIEEVRKYNFLYDISDSKYSDITKKDEAWKKISDILSVLETTCKKTWSNLREAHRRAIRKKTTKSGQAAVPDKKWQYEDEMSFLLPHYKERATITSLSRDSDLESVGNDDSHMSALDRQSDASEHHETSITEDRLQSDASTSSTKFSNFTKTSNKRRFQEEGPSASSLLMKYIIDEKQNKKEEDDIDKFFTSLASTVKKLNDYNKAMIKSKMFNIVSQIELQELGEKQNCYHVNNNYSSSGPSGYNTTMNYASQKDATQQNTTQEFNSAQQNSYGAEKDLPEFP